MRSNGPVNRSMFLGAVQYRTRTCIVFCGVKSCADLVEAVQLQWLKGNLPGFEPTTFGNQSWQDSNTPPIVIKNVTSCMRHMPYGVIYGVI